MAAELCPGIIFPTPYPQGYGDTPLLPRACPPIRGVPGSMPEPAADGNAAWWLQPSTGRHRPHRRPTGVPVASRRRSQAFTDVGPSDRKAPPVVGTSVTPPPPGSFRARTTVRPGLRTLPGPSARTAPGASPVAGRGRRAGRAHSAPLTSLTRPTPLITLIPLIRVGERGGPLGGVQLSAGPCRAGRLRHIRGRGRRRGPRPRRRDRRLPGAAATVRAHRGPRPRGRIGAAPRPARQDRPWGEPGRSARDGKCARRLTGSHTGTRMFSANFALVASPWRNGLPTPLPPGKKGPFASRAPYGDGPCRRCTLPCAACEWNAS